MTIREQLNQHLRWLTGAYVSWLCLCVGGILGCEAAGTRTFPVVVAGVAVLVSAAVLSHHLAYRCSRCRKNLASLVIAHRGRFCVDPQAIRCPYCACELDQAFDVD